ncbi:MAG: mechanosensitive ion channel [Pedobacter sp.]|nr:MAG: mechanosensitive ion channel [Pedobacter sp.]
MWFKSHLIIRLLILSSCFSVVSKAQTKDKPLSDSIVAPKSYVTQMQAFAKKSDSMSNADLKADKAELIQEATLVEIKKSLQKAKLYLRTGLDTNFAKQELLLIDRHAHFKHEMPIKGHLYIYRDLVATQKILKVLLERSNIQKSNLDRYKKKLSGFKFTMDSLSNTRELFEFPQDSVKLSKYMQSLKMVAKEVVPIDSLIDQAVLQVQTLQNMANSQVYSLENALDEVEQSQRRMSSNVFRKELPMIWESLTLGVSLKESLKYSYKKARLNLLFFTRSNTGLAIITFVLLGVCYAFILALKNSYEKKEDDEETEGERLILKSPLLSAIFLVSNLAQFLFESPPFVFSLGFWIISAISLTLIMNGFITKFWMRAWLVMLCLFILSALDNLLLQPTTLERWAMFFLSLLGIAVGITILKTGKREELREKLILYAIGLMVFLELLALFLNVFGSYNPAKAFLIAGYVNVIIAIMFLWTVRLINQGLQLAFNLYAKQDVSLFFMNFDRVGHRAPSLLYAMLVIGWLILFGRNFPAYAFVVEPVRNFFFDQRAIGSYTFSVSSLILFFFVVSVSVVVSKVVSFFAVDKRILSKQENGRKGLGSWILLIRITIIILGLFLAFASVGIPIDKIAIVLGALGVGIGFGLQSLVNNLVSGLVIAFEKPLNLDDEVEVAGKSGTVKSIGFRSSVIATFDGAEVVMPNGDLLNSHLINWSGGGGKRRSSIVLNIAQGENLQMIKEEILKIVAEDDRILKHPEPSVFFQDINAESLELHLYYWSRQSKPTMEIKSDMLIAVNTFFISNKIRSPYPRQEVFIHNPAKEKK